MVSFMIANVLVCATLLHHSPHISGEKVRQSGAFTLTVKSLQRLYTSLRWKIRSITLSVSRIYNNSRLLHLCASRHCGFPLLCSTELLRMAVLA